MGGGVGFEEFDLNSFNDFVPGKPNKDTAVQNPPTKEVPTVPVVQDATAAIAEISVTAPIVSDTEGLLVPILYVISSCCNYATHHFFSLLFDQPHNKLLPFIHLKLLQSLQLFRLLIRLMLKTKMTHVRLTQLRALYPKKSFRTSHA